MTSKPIITYYDGIGTIGGTKVAVQDGEYRVIFDFGITYAPGGDFWGGKVQSRTGAARLRDMVGLGYAPAIDGLYKLGEAETLGLKPARDEKTHVFISHLHLDHMALVDLLGDSVPVWMHQDALRLFRAVAATGEQPAVPVGARGFNWGEPIQIGPIKVTPVAVDHDVPGASALLIETSAGTVVYTGDLRLHGANPELVNQFIAAAKAAHPAMLLIEGTRLGEVISPDRPPTRKEAEVAPVVAEAVSQAEGLALITLYPRNTLRNANIAAAMPAVGRTLLLSPETASIYAGMGGDLNGVAIYQREKDKQAVAEGRAPSWLLDLFASGARVLDAAAVRADQSKYLLQLFYWDINELVDLQPVPGSIFIHSNGEPLGKYDPAYELFTRWLEHFNLNLVMVPSTGHASAADLHAVVAAISPQILVPIHSKAPELMAVEGIRRNLPERGASYDIATGALIG